MTTELIATDARPPFPRDCWIQRLSDRQMQEEDTEAPWAIYAIGHNVPAPNAGPSVARYVADLAVEREHLAKMTEELLDDLEDGDGTGRMRIAEYVRTVKRYLALQAPR